MAYQTNPTFTDNNVLLASELNILADNIAFLYSLVSGVNQPFTGETMTGSGNSRSWSFRRQGRYLHYKMRMVTGTSDELDIRIDGNIEYTDATNRAAPYSWTGYVDLQATTSAPDIGEWYEVYIEFDFTSGNDFRVDYLIESDGLSL